MDTGKGKQSGDEHDRENIEDRKYETIYVDHSFKIPRVKCK